METTIKCGKHLAEHANMSGSRFHDVNLSTAEFDDVNMRGTTFHNINMSDSMFRKIDMANVRIIESNTTGMMIDGIPVADMIAAYKQQKK